MKCWIDPGRRCISTLGCHDRSLDEIIVLCKKYGIGKLEIRGIGGEPDNRRITDFSEDIIAETAAKMTNAGVNPYILGTSCKFDTDETAEKSLAEGIFSVDTAKKLGCMGIRIFGNRVSGGRREACARLARNIGLLCGYADEKNVNILLETHGDFNSADTLNPVLERVGDLNNFGLIWDIAHTDTGTEDRWMSFYGAFRPFIRHVHIKDAEGGRLCLPGDGTLPVDRICGYLSDNGFTGAFSLEWERKWHPELPPIEDAIERILG